MALKITLRHENGKDRADCVSFALANSTLSRWSNNSHRTLGYDKIDFTIVDVERDLAYQGRYDLEHWSTRLADLGHHVTRTIAYMAGIGQPRHMSEEQYAVALKSVSPCARAQANDYLMLVSSLLRAEMTPEHDAEPESGQQDESDSAPRM